MYGSEEGYGERVMLLYDGIHYDALALAGGAPRLPLLSPRAAATANTCNEVLFYFLFSSPPLLCDRRKKLFSEKTVSDSSFLRAALDTRWVCQTRCT